MSEPTDDAARPILIRGGHLLAPEDVGERDILVFGDRIAAVDRRLSAPTGLGRVDVIDARGMRVIPGLIDQHVHFLGGGDGDGPDGRVPELHLSDLSTAGVTTAVGLLGVDIEMKTLPMLLRKAHELDRQGLTTFIYTGAMRLPAPFITSSIRSDIILIEKVVGVKSAVAERLYPNRYPADFAQLAGEALQARAASGKAAIMHVHVGRLAEGLRPILDLIECGVAPYGLIVPTHVNRDPGMTPLFEQGMAYAKNGGVIDLTCCLGPQDGIPSGLDIVAGLERCREAGVPLANITLSTDANVAVPAWGQDGKPAGLRAVPPSILWRDIVRLMRHGAMAPSDALALATSNVARVLGLSRRKGRVRPGFDADLVLVDQDDRLDTVMARGRRLVRARRPLATGPFERQGERLPVEGLAVEGLAVEGMAVERSA